MFIDDDLEMDNGTPATGTLDFGINIGNADGTTFDTGAAGQCANMELLLTVTEAFASGTSAATVTFQLFTHTASPATGGSILIASKAFTVAQATLGITIWRVRIPPEHLRYIQLRGVVATENATAGCVSAHLVIDRQSIE